MKNLVLPKERMTKMIKGKFIDNLPKVYGIYTGGFLVFIILMAIAEQAGMSAKLIGIFFVAFTVSILSLIHI